MATISSEDALGQWRMRAAKALRSGVSQASTRACAAALSWAMILGSLVLMLKNCQGTIRALSWEDEIQ
jgi:hypothetical protein